MDGDGQSMLSIVQSLRDAGLVVTVVDSKFGRNNSTAVLAINTASRPYERRSLGINTKLRPTHHSSTQANDTRHANVYQLTHNGFRPTSPSVYLSEFPPQRATPHLTEGNFEVRGWRSRESQYTPVRSSHSCRGNLRWTDRVGSVYRYSEDTSAFAHSLRKYPNLTPNRSLSTEIVQRLLSYTQAKSFTKSSSNTQNVRPIRPSSPKTQKSAECQQKPSKNIQAYARKRESRDKASNTAYQINCQGILPGDRSRNSTNKRPSNTYDYLKRTKPRGWNTRGTEIRYLTDVTKCIKDAIRNICEEAATPLMCPSVQSRYSQHRKMHHLQANGQQATSSCNNNSGTVGPDEPGTYGIIPCGSPNSACPRIRNRFHLHKKQQHGGQKSVSHSKTTEVQACPPPVVREACIMTKSGQSTAQQHVCPAPVKTCCYCKRPLPCHCRSELERKIEKVVLDWVKEIPVYSDDTTDNKHLRYMLSKKLVENLLIMIKSGVFEKVREEIDKCLNVLPMWCPENDNDKTAFKNQLAENLLSRLKQFMEKDSFREKIMLWFNELPFLDKIKPEDRDKFIDNLITKLKAVDRLSNDNDYREALKNEVVKILNEIPGIDKDVIMQMAQKLVNDLVPTDIKEQPESKEIRKKICEWIDDTSEFAENGFYVKDNTQFIDDLSNTLTERRKGTDSENVKELMRKDISEWLQNTLKTKNVFFDHNTTNKLAQKLIDKIYPSQTMDPYVQSIFDWLKDTPELSRFLTEELLIGELAQKLQDLKEKGYDDDALIQVIIDWINKLCAKHGIHLDPRIVRQLAEKLMDQLKLGKRLPRKPLKLAQNYEETISEEISRILEDDPLTLNSKAKTNLRNKITNILSNSIENVLSDETAAATKNLIKLLQHEGNMTPKEAKDLANTVINSTKAMPLTEGQKKSSTKSKPFRTKEGVKTEIDESAKSGRAHKDIFDDTISDMLADEGIRGTKTDTVADDIYSPLDTSVPDAQFHMSPTTGRQKREMSFELSSQDLNGIAHKSQGVSSTPSHKDNFKQNIERTIFDFIDNVLTNHSPKTIQNIRKGAKAFVDNVSRLIQRKDDGESVVKEVESFLKNVPISSDITRKELVDELTNRLLGSGFQTSTPRKDFSFHPRRLSFDSSVPAVHLFDESEKNTQEAYEENKYREDLTKVVQNWLDKMPISLNDSTSKRFKEVAVNDLVGDMIDRQKYLQLNPDAKMSDTEELENLKYQVFRWLNKVIDAPDFDIVLPKTGALMGAVRRIAVPQLAKPSGDRRDIKKTQGQVPDYLDALQDEISIWVDDIPRHILQSTDKNYHDKIVRQLAKNLQHIDSENIHAEIKKWLNKFFKFSNQDDLDKAAQDLKKKLTKKGFSKDTSWMLEQDSGEFIEENLHGGILDWLKETTFYKFANPQDKNTQEKIVAGMAKGIKNVFETALTASERVDTNDLFIEEIVKHLKRLPLDMKKKSDSSFLTKTATNLLQHLKGLQMFQNISDRHTTTLEDNVNTTDDWINSLPIVDKEDLLENKHFNMLKKQFKQNIKEIKNDGDEQRLREEIKKELKMLPVDSVKLNDKQFVNKKVEQLLKKTQKSRPENFSSSQYEDINIDSGFEPRYGFKGSTDTLYETINRFCDNILFEKGKLNWNSEKVKTVKQTISNKVMKRIEELNMDPEEVDDDLLYKHILDEVDYLIGVSQPSAKTEGSINVQKKSLVTSAGQIYKQQLRDTISKTLPPTEDLSNDELNALELLRDNLADAFINLRFYGGDIREKEKYKNKINKEISKFCDNYLKRHPSTPINAEKLNKDLYAMLNNISLPTEDSIQDEVEETKIKDLITDCVNELPLSHETSAEKLESNRVISLMSKRLHDLEMDKDVLDDYDDKLKSEIIKWTQKLPLKHWRDEDINDFANRLVSELKRTEASRSFNSTKMDTLDFDQSKNIITPYPVSEEQSRPSRVIDSPAARLPPSTLSSEDRDHLQRIRERSMPGRRLKPLPTRKDAAISPAPIDAGSQTEITPWEHDLSVQKSSIPAASELDEALHICQSPLCGLRSPRPCIQSEKPYCHISPKTSERGFNPPREKNRERLLPCDIIQPESLPDDLKSSSCECHPNFVPYIFSPGQDYATPRPCVSSSRHAPRVSRHVCNSPEESPATPKRPKRRDRSPARRDEGHRKTIRPRTAGLGSWGSCQGSSKIPDNYEQSCGIRNFPGTALCGSFSRREVLISDDEFEEKDTEEKFKCGCKEKDLSKNYGRNRSLSCKGECMKRCPKCCGMHCPHPTKLYFRN